MFQFNLPLNQGPVARGELFIIVTFYNQRSRLIRENSFRSRSPMGISASGLYIRTDNLYAFSMNKVHSNFASVHTFLYALMQEIPPLF